MAQFAEGAIMFVVHSAVFGIVVTPLVWWLTSAFALGRGATQKTSARIAAVPTMLAVWLCSIGFQSIGQRQPFLDYFLMALLEIGSMAPLYLSCLIIAPLVAHLLFRKADRV